MHLWKHSLKNSQDFPTISSGQKDFSLEFLEILHGKDSLNPRIDVRFSVGRRSVTIVHSFRISSFNSGIETLHHAQLYRFPMSSLITRLDGSESSKTLVVTSLS